MSNEMLIIVLIALIGAATLGGLLISVLATRLNKSSGPQVPYVTYDPEDHSLFCRIAPTTIHRHTEMETRRVHLDLDGDGRLVGIEIVFDPTGPLARELRDGRHS